MPPFWGYSGRPPDHEDRDIMRFIVDFHAVGEAGDLTTSLEDVVDGTAAGVEKGSEIVLDDLEGHQARARVVDILGDLIDVRIEWVSWEGRRFFGNLPERFDLTGVVTTSDFGAVNPTEGVDSLFPRSRQ
jgi:hypothetical protein